MLAQAQAAQTLKGQHEGQRPASHLAICAAIGPVRTRISFRWQGPLAGSAPPAGRGQLALLTTRATPPTTTHSILYSH